MRSNQDIMRKFFLLLPGILIAATALAQEDTTKAKELEPVVITGQYRQQSVKNSVYQVRVITKDRIQRQGASQLQDVLKNELNIRFSQDPATGGSGITMMGLSGQNVKVLIDGLPMIGRQGTSNEIDINQVDINSIERIEIVEGPMSVVYGADALAGVINIITKKANTAKWSVNARVHEESIGKEYGIKQGIHNQYAGLSWRYKHWEIGGGLGHNYFGGWKDTAIDRELVWHKKDQILGNGFVAYTNGKFSARYRFDGLDEIITNPGNFINAYPQAGDTLAFDQEYLTNRLMQQIQASYFASNHLSFQLQSAYTDYSRQVYSTNVSKHTGERTLAIGSQSLDEFKGFTVRGTALYKLSNTVSFQPGFDVNLESGEGQRLKDGNNKLNDYAFFLTAEITPTSRINVRPGLRVIKNSVYDAPPVIPSINTKFGLSDNLDLRLSYARGFRSPSLRELYFNFIDANHTILGNPNLKAETSHSFTGSLNWKKSSVGGATYTAALNGFYNSIKNKIDYAYSLTSDTVIVANISNSKTAGVSINSVMRYKQWNVQAGAAYTGFYNDKSEVDKSLPTLQWSPEVNIVAGYTFANIGLDLNLFYKFTGKRPMYVTSGPDIVLTEVQGYHIADFTLNKKLGHYLALNAGIRNIFNVDRINSEVATGAIHSSSGLSIGTGRSYFGGLVFNWNKN